MNQVKKIKVEQFNYMGRWVDKWSFTAFVYDKDAQQRLAKSYDEFEQLTGSGIYFASLEEIPKKKKKDN